MDKLYFYFDYIAHFAMSLLFGILFFDYSSVSPDLTYCPTHQFYKKNQNIGHYLQIELFYKRNRKIGHYLHIVPTRICLWVNHWCRGVHFPDLTLQLSQSLINSSGSKKTSLNFSQNIKRGKKPVLSFREVKEQNNGS